jgi:hypothetical protein
MSSGIDFTVTALISGAKRHAMAPSSQSLFQDPDFVEILNHDMVSEVVPLIKSVNEEYFVVTKDVLLVAGVSEYDIPTRALGGSLRDFVLVDDAGRELEIGRLEPEMVKYSGAYTSQRVSGAYLQSGKVIFFPALTNTLPQKYIRFKYERRPNDLCLTDNAGYITAIDKAGLKITLSHVPTAWTANTTLDVIVPMPHFPSIVDDVVITSIVGLDVHISAWTDGLTIGQWVSESCTSPIPQVPYEAHKLLEILGGQRICLTMKDGDLRAVLAADYKRASEMFLKTITPRVAGSPKKVINRNSIFDYNRGFMPNYSTRP